MTERAADAASVVQRGYDAIGPRYAEWSEGDTLRGAHLSRALDRLAPGSVVVDLGCGPGRQLAAVQASGHTAVGVDVSRAQLAIARSNAPAAALVQADITTLALRAGSVDAVVSFFATGHLPAAAHAGFYASVARWLRPGGVYAGTAPVGEGDCIEEGWLGVPMFFGGIGQEATAAAVSSAGLVLESLEAITEDVGEGKTETFLWLVGSRPPIR